jgi:hypothetical protein
MVAVRRKVIACNAHDYRMFAAANVLAHAPASFAVRLAAARALSSRTSSRADFALQVKWYRNEAEIY